MSVGNLGSYLIELDGKKFEVEVLKEQSAALRQGATLSLRINGKAYDVQIAPAQGTMIASMPTVPHNVTVSEQTPQAAAFAAAASSKSNDRARPEPGAVIAPMPGVITAINVSAGQSVSAGQVVAIIEAMKMENNIMASFPGIVERVLVEISQQVDASQPLLVIKADAVG